MTEQEELLKLIDKYILLASKFPHKSDYHQGMLSVRWLVNKFFNELEKLENEPDEEEETPNDQQDFEL